MNRFIALTLSILSAICSSGCISSSYIRTVGRTQNQGFIRILNDQNVNKPQTVKIETVHYVSDHHFPLLNNIYPKPSGKDDEKVSAVARFDMVSESGGKKQVPVEIDGQTEIYTITHDTIYYDAPDRPMRCISFNSEPKRTVFGYILQPLLVVSMPLDLAIDAVMVAGVIVYTPISFILTGDVPHGSPP